MHDLSKKPGLITIVNHDDLCVLHAVTVALFLYLFKVNPNFSSKYGFARALRDLQTNSCALRVRNRSSHARPQDIIASLLDFNGRATQRLH